MELGSLYDLFQTGWRASSLLQQVTLALDVARAMSYLHAWKPPLIHRDLKSLNLLVSSAGGEDGIKRCKVTDFGMTRAKALGQDTGQNGAPPGSSPEQAMTLAMTRCGTPYWTAPEIIAGSRYNETVDQYAYGMCVLEIVTGETPWQVELPVVQGSKAPPKRKQMPPMKVQYCSISLRYNINY